MAYGMELLSDAFGHPELSASVISPSGVDFDKLELLISTCEKNKIPVLLIGGSFAFVNTCEAMENRGKRLFVPEGSRLIDAGGYKGKSRNINANEFRENILHIFGIPPERCLNLFGMTELASQLYDSADQSAGPHGERPKKGNGFVKARLRDLQTMGLRNSGVGLLEVMDLCVIDRPPVILTGDWGIASDEGIAIVGRVERARTRGCSLVLEEIEVQIG
jgi:hypothetical protein